MKIYAARDNSVDKYIGKDVWVCMCDVDRSFSYGKNGVCGTVYYVKFLSSHGNGIYDVQKIWVGSKYSTEIPERGPHFDISTIDAAYKVLQEIPKSTVYMEFYHVFDYVLSTEELAETMVYGN